MEHIILEFISKHAKDKNVIGNSQNGVTTGKSSLINLTPFCNKLTDYGTFFWKLRKYHLIGGLKIDLPAELGRIIICSLIFTWQCVKYHRV